MYYSPGNGNILAEDSSVLKEIIPYQVKMNVAMSETLAWSLKPIEKGQPESRLGNLVSDLCFEAANRKYVAADNHGIDFCVLNNGGLRSSLPEGAITRKNVFELMPFENELVVLTLPGKVVGKVLQYISQKGGVPVSNLRMKLSNSELAHVYIGGSPFEITNEYKILTSDYLANGGDGMDMLKENLKSELINCKVRDAIIESLIARNRNNEKINPETDGRIQ